MPKVWKISWVLDDSQPAAAFKRGAKSIADIEAAMARVAKAADGSLGGIAKAAQAAAAKRVKVEDEANKKIDVGFYKVAFAGIQYQDKLAAAAKKRVDTVAALETQYAAKDYRGRVQAVARKDALDAAAAKRFESSALGPYGRLALVRRKDLTDEQINAAARNKIFDRVNNDRIKGVMRLHGIEKDNFAESIANAYGLGSAATSAGLALATIGAATAGVKLVAGALFEAKENAVKLSQAGLDWTATLKPLASVVGAPADAAFAKKISDFNVATTLGQTQGPQFLEALHGKAQIAVGAGKNISTEEFDKFKVKAGQVAAVKGLAGNVAGDLAGGVVKAENLQAKGQGSKEALARLAGVVKILDAGSGNLNVLAPQLTEVLASMTNEDELKGVFRNAPEAAVATSVAAEAVPGESATMVKQTFKGLRDFADKDKAPFFKRAGITPMDPGLVAMGKAIKAFGDDVKAGVPIDQAIVKAGFSERIEKTGLKTFFNASETTLKPQMANLAAATGPGAGEAAQKQLDEALKLQVNRDAANKAVVEREKLSRADAAAELAIARKAGEAELIGEGLDDTWAGLVKQKFAGVLTLGQTAGRDVLAGQRGLNRMRRDVGAAQTEEIGLKHVLSLLVPGLAGSLTGIGGTARDVLGDSAGAARDLKRAADGIERMAKQGGVTLAAPPLLPGAPPGGGGPGR